MHLLLVLLTSVLGNLLTYGLYRLYVNEYVPSPLINAILANILTMVVIYVLYKIYAFYNYYYNLEKEYKKLQDEHLNTIINNSSIIVDKKSDYSILKMLLYGIGLPVTAILSIGNIIEYLQITMGNQNIRDVVAKCTTVYSYLNENRNGMQTEMSDTATEHNIQFDKKQETTQVYSTNNQNDKKVDDVCEKNKQTEAEIMDVYDNNIKKYERQIKVIKDGETSETENFGVKFEQIKQSPEKQNE
jgi:hypothetical protein